MRAPARWVNPLRFPVRGNQVPRSAASGGTLAERFSGAAWKVAADLLAAALSLSLNWVCSTFMRCLDSESPAVAAMEYHLKASSRLCGTPSPRSYSTARLNWESDNPKAAALANQRAASAMFFLPVAPLA